MRLAACIHATAALEAVRDYMPEVDGLGPGRHRGRGLQPNEVIAALQEMGRAA
jgi:hypothetical protein